LLLAILAHPPAHCPLSTELSSRATRAAGHPWVARPATPCRVILSEAFFSGAEGPASIFCLVSGLGFSHAANVAKENRGLQPLPARSPCGRAPNAPDRLLFPEGACGFSPTNSRPPTFQEIKYAAQPRQNPRLKSCPTTRPTTSSASQRITSQAPTSQVESVAWLQV
jgi:hypothetical protein